MYRMFDSLCCVIGTHVVLLVDWSSKTIKQNSKKKGLDLWLPEERVGGWEIK